MSELSIPFQEILVPFIGGSSFERYRKFSPTGKVPCLTDGNLVVWDSLAIAEYLAERHPGVWPADREARAFARSAAAEMHSGFAVLRDRCGMNCGIRVKLFEMPDALKRDIARIEELWGEGLRRFGGPFLAGAAFTASDAFFAPVAFRVQTYGLELEPAASSYAARLLALPSMQKWEADALAETWRDEGHEDEVRRAGVWLEDRRAEAQ